MKKYMVVMLMGLLMTISSCSCSLKYKDISDRKKYRHHIGQQYEVIGRVDIYALKSRPQGEVEYYALVPLPGFSGWEIDSRKIVLPGGKITILKVMDTNRLVDCSKEFWVTVERENYPPTPARLDMYTDNRVGSCREMRLNPNIYRKI